MGSERASTVRQIRSGEICALCRSHLPRPQTYGERLCPKCRAESKRHRVYMSFQSRKGWHCQFLEEDLKTPLPRKITFTTDDKVREMAKRGGANLSLETLHAIEHGIDIGRGGGWLELTEEQYSKLKQP
jgi:hypothetical protein